MKYQEGEMKANKSKPEEGVNGEDSGK